MSSCTPSKPSLLNCSSGFTIMELLVASALGLGLVGLSLGVIMANRGVYKQDVVRTRINQNLRSGIDIISLNLRQAGEALDRFFPAIEVINGTSGAPDELILRRNLHENEILNVCQALTAGAVNATIQVSYQTVNNACAYNTDVLPYLNTWTTYRTDAGGVGKAYVFNRSTKDGEFFDYTGENDTGTEMSIAKGLSTWQHDYPGDGLSAGMYLLEELHFSVVDGVLQFIQNDDSANPLNVVDGIDQFQVSILMNDGTLLDTFTTAQDWTDIDYVEISMTGTETSGGRPISSQLTTRLYPRNIMSN